MEGSAYKRSAKDVRCRCRCRTADHLRHPLVWDSFCRSSHCSRRDFVAVAVAVAIAALRVRVRMCVGIGIGQAACFFLVKLRRRPLTTDFS